jgi:exonuclease 1
MGITGLLPLLSSITNEVNIKNYSGKTVAIDGYCWLHRGSYSCSFELCQNIPTDKYKRFSYNCHLSYFLKYLSFFFRYISFFMHMINMFVHNGVTPLVVFDGGYLPAKMGQEDDRRRFEFLSIYLLFCLIS